MSDKPVTVEIPEELLTQVEFAHLDVRQIMIKALEQALAHAESSEAAPSLQPDATDDGIRPTLKEIEAAIKASQERLASPNAPRRTLGWHQGTIWVSDDFDDELPDEFWFGEDTPAS
jgi:hypothetical protein